MSSALQAALWGQGDAAQQSVPDDYPFDEARRLLKQYLSVRDYFLGDFYPLTEYTPATDAWMAYQLDRPEQGDGLLVVLKRERSPYERAMFRLRGLDTGRSYEVTDLDSGRADRVGGDHLTTEGLVIELDGAPASAMIRYAAAAE
jgi:alpha-galactosidase